MKSGQRNQDRLIGPGDNDYGRKEPFHLEPLKKIEIAKELTPKLSEKIWKSFEKRMYDERVSKEIVLHHLKQLKAQMGKLRNKKPCKGYRAACYTDGVTECMEAIDKKIEKINSK